MSEEGTNELPVKPTDPRIGQTIQDRYRIVRRLGEGGMGIVYEGEHLMIKRRVAIKLLHAQFASDPMVVKRFHNEAIAATSIGNPHIVEVTDMGTLEDGTFFMVLEFLEGHDFDHLIETEGPQPVGRVVHILSQACGALQAAHDKGIIHRDLKPENLYLIEREEDPHFVKVLDFGIAKFKENKDESMTQTGQTIGTPHYMSPEQLQGSKDLDARADLYALGVIMYHALTRRHPFEAETFPLLVMRIFNDAPVPLTTFRQDVPPELVKIIDHLLAKNPAHRYQSAKELKDALAPFRTVESSPNMVANAPAVGTVPSTSVAATQAMLASGPMAAPPAPPSMASGVMTGSMYSAPAAPASKIPLLIAFASLLIVAGLVGVVLLTQMQSSGTERDSTVVAGDDSAQDEAPELVSVTVRTVPPNRPRLLLDGDPVANPFISQLPASREGYRIEARLDGYDSATQTFSLRSPQEIILTLTARDAGAPVAANSEASTPTGRSGRRRGRARSRASTAAEETTEEASSAQASAEPPPAAAEPAEPPPTETAPAEPTGPTKNNNGIVTGLRF